MATADTLVVGEMQRAMAAMLGADVREVRSDHVAFIEQPDELAAILNDVARALAAH